MSFKQTKILRKHELTLIFGEVDAKTHRRSCTLESKVSNLYTCKRFTDKLNI